MPLLSTGNWKINGNGWDGVLLIGTIDAQGNLLQSTAYGNGVIGFWNDDSRKITFMRITIPGDPSTFQYYTGYLMSDNKTLAGSFEALQGTGGTARQSVFGWLATWQNPKGT